MIPERINKLISLPMWLWDKLDAEAKAEKRNGRSKQLEVILEERYLDAPVVPGNGASMKRLGTKRGAGVGA